MRSLPLLPILLLALIGSAALAQESVEPQVIHASQGITVTALGPSNSNGNGALVTLDEVYLTAQQVSATMRDGSSIATFTLGVTARERGVVTIDFDHEDLLIRGESRVQLRPGEPRSLNFTAFSAHAGSITIRNDQGEVLAVVPYEVAHEDPYRQRVSFSMSDSLSLSGSYGISFKSGVSLGLSLRLSQDGRLRGSVNGSYSW